MILKNKNTNDVFTKLLLDDEEQALETAFEKGEYEEAPHFEDTKKMLEEAATRYLELNTSKPVTIRINQMDLIKVKSKAKMSNIPYQTLLGALIHSYAEGEENLSI